MSLATHPLLALVVTQTATCYPCPHCPQGGYDGPPLEVYDQAVAVLGHPLSRGEGRLIADLFSALLRLQPSRPCHQHASFAALRPRPPFAYASGLPGALLYLQDLLAWDKDHPGEISEEEIQEAAAVAAWRSDRAEREALQAHVCEVCPTLATHPSWQNALALGTLCHAQKPAVVVICKACHTVQITDGPQVWTGYQSAWLRAKAWSRIANNPGHG